MLIKFLLLVLLSQIFVIVSTKSDRQISLFFMMKILDLRSPEKILDSRAQRRRRRRHVARENLFDGEENANLYNENDGRRFRDELFDQERDFRLPANRKLKPGKNLRLFSF